jgi:hypothetical protein
MEHLAGDPIVVRESNADRGREARERWHGLRWIMNVRYDTESKASQGIEGEREKSPGSRLWI